MKDIKTLMIGFLLATCMFLLMGQGSSKSDIGRFQVSTQYRDMGNWIFETIIDSKTGAIVSRKQVSALKYYDTYKAKKK